MDDKRSFYEEERAREAAEEEGEKKAPDTESDDGYFRFDDKSEVRMPHPPSEPPQKNTLQTTALILSIVSFFCCGFPLSVVALVLAILDRRRRGRWEGMTTVALVLSIVGLVFSLVSIIYSVFVISLIFEMIEDLGGELPPEVTGAVFGML